MVTKDTQKPQTAFQSIKDSKDAQFECCDAAGDIHARLDDGHERMDRIEVSMNTMAKDTAEVLEILQLGRSFFKVAGHLGNFIKWSAGICVPLVVIYMTYKPNKP